MTKSDMVEAVLAAKKAKGLTWAALAAQVGLGEVWLASCGYMEIEKEPHPKGDRVVVTLNGKFLPYTKW